MTLLAALEALEMRRMRPPLFCFVASWFRLQEGGTYCCCREVELVRWVMMDSGSWKEEMGTGPWSLPRSGSGDGTMEPLYIFEAKMGEVCAVTRGEKPPKEDERAMGVRCEEERWIAQAPLALSREELRLKAIFRPKEGLKLKMDEAGDEAKDTTDDEPSSSTDDGIDVEEAVAEIESLE